MKYGFRDTGKCSIGDIIVFVIIGIVFVLIMIGAVLGIIETGTLFLGHK